MTELPDEKAAWDRVNELDLKPHAHDVPLNPQITFGEVAANYVKFELPDDQSNATIEKTEPTITKYKHYLSQPATWKKLAMTA